MLGFSQRSSTRLPALTSLPPPLSFSSFHLVQYACGPPSPPSHLPMSLAAKPPSRDLLKWNIWFHFEVPKHLNHLARKDAGRAVKLLCLAAGSPSPGGEHEERRGYHQAPRDQKPMSGNVATVGCCVFILSGDLMG